MSNWFENTLDVLSPGWVGSIISLVGIITAAVTYTLTRQRTRFAYCHAGERLLGLLNYGLPSEVTVQFCGQNIPRLTRTLLVFWNDGEKTIPGEDIVASDPLRLELETEDQVLAATILKVTREVCHTAVSIDISRKNIVELKFQFLDSGDGAVVEVLHTSKNAHPTLLGTIRGLPDGFKNLGPILGRNFVRRSRWPLPASPNRLGWVVVGVGIAIAVTSQVITGEGATNACLQTIPVRFGFTIGAAFYAVLGGILILSTRRRYPKTLHIEKFS